MSSVCTAILYWQEDRNGGGCSAGGSGMRQLNFSRGPAKDGDSQPGTKSRDSMEGVFLI